MLAWILCAVLAVIVVILLIKLAVIRKSVDEILSSFEFILSEDTNVLVTTASGDRCIRRLAGAINEELRALRRQRIRYLNGDKEIKEAVTNISHDLRTPLTAISGYLELLEKEEKSEAVERYLQVITNRTEALKALTEELFRYTVVLSEDNLTLETVDLRAVLEESLLGFYGALTDAGIVPDITLTDKKIPRQLNRGAMSRIFGNIINNAIKYSDGDLIVRMSDDGEICFKNHASGLDKLQVEKLFNRFYTVQEAGGGVGLGLSIARTLTEQMGGSIRAEYIEHMLAIYVKI